MNTKNYDPSNKAQNATQQSGSNKKNPTQKKNGSAQDKTSGSYSECNP